jgi:nucleoside-diphosphate-sugar epimerase
MIVGDGLLARAFARRYADDPHVTIFASGVSDSLEVREHAFARERELLDSVLARSTARAVYFSCCSLWDCDAVMTPYMRHKRDMESRVRVSAGGLVLRLPQVVGPAGNPRTLANYLHKKIMAGERFEVWRHAERNLIDVEDVAAIATAMIEGPDDAWPLRSIATPWSLGMPEIVAIFERVLARTADFTMVDKGRALPVDATEAVSLAARLGIDFGPDYPERLLRKYYGPGAP